MCLAITELDCVCRDLRALHIRNWAYWCFFFSTSEVTNSPSVHLPSLLLYFFTAALCMMSSRSAPLYFIRILVNMYTLICSCVMDRCYIICTNVSLNIFACVGSTFFFCGRPAENFLLYRISTQPASECFSNSSNHLVFWRVKSWRWIVSKEGKNK